MSKLIKCPVCSLKLPEADLVAQRAHMESEHPEMIEQRRREAARWDGWEDA